MKKFFFSVKIYYLIYLLRAFNAFVNESGWMNLATWLLAALGAAAAVCMAVQFRRYKDVRNIRLLLLFLASHILSSVINYRYGIIENVKELIWLFLFMVFLYASARICTADEMKREFRILAFLWTAITSVFNLISISMVVWGREYGIYQYSGGKVVGFKEVGFKWGRLWGVYDDPNHGAAIAAASVLLAAYLFCEVKSKVVKVLLALSVVVQFLYIMLSDSRTGLIILGTALFLWTAGKLYIRKKERTNGKTGMKALLISLAAGAAVACIAAGGVLICKQSYNVLDKKIEAYVAQKKTTDSQDKDKDKSGQVGRKKDIQDDASNGRLAIWESGLEIVRTTPIWGTSFRNITEYAKDNMPETYLIENPEGSAYDSLHNSVMDVLVSQGVIGILIVLCLIGNTIYLIRKNLLNVKEEDRSFVLLCFCGMASLAAGSMFLSMVFYLNAPQTFLFWICFGCFTEILGRGEKRA